MEVPPNIKAKLSNLSSRPGVYLMRDRFGRVIYVGKAKALNKRVRSYFQPGRFHQMDPKTRALVEMAADFDVHEVRNETEAIILEGKLIKEYKPKYNIAFRDDKRFLLVRLTRDPFPRFVLTRLQKPDGCRYFGPFIHSVALRNTLEYLRKNFHIRSCPPVEPSERDYKHCMNDILKHCSAPCVGRVTQEEYQRWIERACDFLEGRDEGALKEMEDDMTKAAGRKDYERAAVLRDALHDLRQTVKQSARKFARDMPRHINPETELAALQAVLGLEGIPRVIEGFDISHIHGQHTVGSMVQFVGGRPARAGYRHFNIKGVQRSALSPQLSDVGADAIGDPSGPRELIPQSEIRPALRQRLSDYARALRRDGERRGENPKSNNDDFASIREIVGRRYRRLKDEGKPLPDLVLIDGGRGQLNYALMALQEIGVSLPVIGLAKDEEEIYMPDRAAPLKLPDSSPALHLLQRVRDESHRFANTHHEGWRRKQIRESMLDELPGLGAKRKAALLKKFGSLEKLRKATVEEIGMLPGFGGKSSEILWRFLRRQV